MNGFTIDIEKATLENTNFRKVLYTAKHSQLVVMCLQPQEEIGTETHTNNDQFFRFEHGNGTCVIDGNEHLVTAGSAIVVPAGTKHNIVNLSETEELKMYTLYCPPHHKDGIIHATKQEAEAKGNEEKFTGTTTE